MSSATGLPHARMPPRDRGGDSPSRQALPAAAWVCTIGSAKDCACACVASSGTLMHCGPASRNASLTPMDWPWASSGSCRTQMHWPWASSGSCRTPMHWPWASNGSCRTPMHWARGGALLLCRKESHAIACWSLIRERQAKRLTHIETRLITASPRHEQPPLTVPRIRFSACPHDAQARGGLDGNGGPVRLDCTARLRPCRVRRT